MRFRPGPVIKYPAGVFRRSSDAAEAAETPETEPIGEGRKGRPTPKRSEAEKLRRNQLITAPKTRKEAYKKVRQDQAKNREKAREGMQRGDEKFLPKRDQGPVRKFARDYVDSRRTFGQYLMVFMLVVVLASFVRVPILMIVATFVPPVLLAVVLTESLLIAQGVKKQAAERFPGQNLKGVGLYAAVRSLQIRRFRIPAPVVKMGDKNKI